MKTGNRLLAIVAGALVVGVGGNFLAGPAPAAVAAVAPVDAGWTVPGSQAPDLAAAARVWEERGPWGMAPKPVEPMVAEVVVPDPVPVGVVGTGKDRRAVFLVAGEGPRTFASGEELPGGGRVTGVAERSVAWTDAKGEARRRQLFVDVAADTASAAYAAADATGGTAGPRAPVPGASVATSPVTSPPAAATGVGARPSAAAANAGSPRAPRDRTGARAPREPGPRMGARGPRGADGQPGPRERPPRAERQAN